VGDSAANDTRSGFEKSAPGWLRRAGVQAWLFVGIVAAAAIVLAGVSVLKGIVVPLVLAAVAAILFRPLVDGMEKRRIPRVLGTIITIVLIIVVVIALVAMIVWGIVDQGPEIGTAISEGVEAIGDWLEGYDIDPDIAASAETTVRSALPELGQGIVGAAGNVFSSAIGFFVGVFFGFFILFFMLKDGVVINGWVGRHLAKDPELGAEILEDSEHSVRAYFKGTAITAMATSLVVTIPLILLDVPLVLPIWLVYFFSSFIPYLGAWIGGAFAVLITLGTGGVEDALIILVAVVISNGMIQSAVNSWAVGGELELHPLVIFLVTIAAGTVGGVTLMILAAPLTAIAVKTVQRLSAAGALDD
jgi:predicted PurR-regulated permease PerM